MTDEEERGQWFSRPGGQEDDGTQAGVGKYLAIEQDGVPVPAQPVGSKPALLQKRKQMSDFDAW